VSVCVCACAFLRRLLQGSQAAQGIRVLCSPSLFAHPVTRCRSAQALVLRTPVLTAAAPWHLFCAPCCSLLQHRHACFARPVASSAATPSRLSAPAPQYFLNYWNLLDFLCNGLLTCCMCLWWHFVVTHLQPFTVKLRHEVYANLEAEANYLLLERKCVCQSVLSLSSACPQLVLSLSSACVRASSACRQAFTQHGCCTVLCRTQARMLHWMIMAQPVG